MELSGNKIIRKDLIEKGPEWFRECYREWCIKEKYVDLSNNEILGVW